MFPVVKVIHSNYVIENPISWGTKVAGHLELEHFILGLVLPHAGVRASRLGLKFLVFTYYLILSGTAIYNLFPRLILSDDGDRWIGNQFATPTFNALRA